MGFKPKDDTAARLSQQQEVMTPDGFSRLVKSLTEKLKAESRN